MRFKRLKLKHLLNYLGLVWHDDNYGGELEEMRDGELTRIKERLERLEKCCGIDCWGHKVKKLKP